MKKLIFMVIIVFTTITINAQERTISGIVSDVFGSVADIVVSVKGTTKGTITNFDGYYAVKAKTGDVLTFKHISYTTVEKIVGTSNTINVTLKESKTTLEEVVVTAYGVRVRKEKTSHSYAVSTTTNNGKNRRKNRKTKPNLISTLNGKAAGVNINSSNGLLGSRNKVIIRCLASTPQNEPLYVIDGVPYTQKKMRHKLKNTNKIKSVNVLKGANATSLYGSQAANGIILITTKNGENKMTSKQQKDLKLFLAQQQNENESYEEITENQFEDVQFSPLSTFSIDVDRASYSNIRRFINNGQKVPTDAVKIEEMINYFNYNYEQPKGKHPFAISTEVASSPWNKNAKVVRIGLQGKEIANDKIPASNLVFLIDVSGSMSDSNKLPLLKSAFKLLVKQLRNKDKVSIVVYAGAAGMVLEPTSGDDKNKIIQALDNLQSGGSTAGGAGIELAYKIAQENFIKNGNNRIILATDGDFNVGASSNKSMEDLIVEKRKSGVFLTCLGFGMGNYKDSKLETLADKGNGNHAYIDTMQEAKRVLGTEFGGTLYTIAKDVKIQVEFNPTKVQAYRLIGYENRMLADKDFKDDTKDAGELGSNHNVTAIYELIPVGVKSEYLKHVDSLKYTKTEVKGNFNNELLTVKFRYKKPDGKKSIKMVHIVKDAKTNYKNASKDFKFAITVASFGMKLRNSKFNKSQQLQDVINMAKKAKGEDQNGYRAEFIRLVETVDLVN